MLDSVLGPLVLGNGARVAEPHGAHRASVWLLARGFRHYRLAELAGLGTWLFYGLWGLLCSARALSPHPPPADGLDRDSSRFCLRKRAVCVEGGRACLGVGRASHGVPVGMCNNEGRSNITVSRH